MLTVIEKVILLQNVDIFAEVPSELLAYLAAIAEEVEFPGDHEVYAEDGPSDAMYLVLSGRVRLHRGDVEVTSARAHQAFGTWALFDDEPRLATATTLEPTEALVVRRDDFIDVLADNARVTQAVLRAVVRRLRSLGRSVR
ncbi:MAG: Crp/Fnr family transcriptional regulator [Myxococcota bacterium]